MQTFVHFVKKRLPRDTLKYLT